MTPRSEASDLPAARIHPLANVEPGAELGAGATVWQFATVRVGARVGESSVLGQGVFVDADVEIGARCKLENYASLHRGSLIGPEVFIGPGVILCNDMWPRATTADGELKSPDDWQCQGVTVGRRASLGARSVILPGVRIGENAMIGAGAVVTRDVDAWAIVTGNPARLVRIIPEEERSYR